MYFCGQIRLVILTIEILLTDFGFILLFIIGAIIFVPLALFISSLLSPKRPNEEKLAAYECGEDTVNHASGQFNSRFYVVGLIFMLFEAELVFLFPWSVVFGKKAYIKSTDGLWGWFSFSEMLIFILILALGLVYIWKKGFLDWVKPMIHLKTNALPTKYKAFNDKTDTLTNK
ncbi:NADH-quinone oxidoreductase subunit A [Thermoflexibacter ruber]|uniref:NADH-quinone oxidoreductase subunit A n=1 Tax=Thermoflexibacter ruber TaxID=1003 RepID=A0A1I2INI2_9BACT|nr:NADH-quinone oxidoreductase subunit A [Thermoflexibacter ruber]SFF43865.1 NADH dehydrogenase subunit A [Thermoflexibacter ruber]